MTQSLGAIYMSDPVTTFKFEDMRACTKASADLCQVKLQPNPTPGGKNLVSCLWSPSFEILNPDEYKKMWNPDFQEFVSSVPFLTNIGHFKSFCRSRDPIEPAKFDPKDSKKMIAPAKYAVFASKSEAPASNPTSQPAANGISQGIPAACNPQLGSDAAKRMSAKPGQLEVAKYIKSLFPMANHVCHGTDKDGNFYFAFATDTGALDFAIQKNRENIQNNKLPKGIAKEVAESWTPEFERIKKLDPPTIGKDNTDRQLAQVNRNLWITLTVQAVSTGFIVTFFALQYKVSKKMLNQQAELIQGKFGPPIPREQIATDLVEKAAKDLAKDNPLRKYNEIMGRDAEAIRYLERTFGNSKQNVLLVGESGVGKDFIIERAAQLIFLKDPRLLRLGPDIFSKKIFKVNVSEYTGKMGIVGSSGRLFTVLRGIMAEGHAVYVPEFADLLDVGSSGGGPRAGDTKTGESFGSIGKDATGEETSRLTGSTTPRGYRRILSSGLYEDYERRVPPEFVEDMAPEVVKDIIKDKTIPKNELKHGVKIAPEALEIVMADAQRATQIMGRAYIIEQAESIIEKAANIATRERADAVIAEETAKGTDLQNPKNWDAIHKKMRSDADGSPIKVTDEHLKQAILEARIEVIKKEAMRRKIDPNDNDHMPPPAATGEPGAFPMQFTPEGDKGTERITVNPWVKVPDLAHEGVKMVAGDAVAINVRPMIDKAVAAIRDFVSAKPARVVTPEGFTFNVMLNGNEAVAESSAVKSTFAEAKKMVKANSVSSQSFVAGAMPGVGTGVIGLTITEGYQHATGKAMPWYGELGAFIGTGTVASVVESAIKNVPVSGRSLVVSPIAGLPASLIGFAGTAVYGKKILELDDKTNKWFTVIGGSLLVHGGMTATVGGTSAMGMISSGMAAGSVGMVAAGAGVAALYVLAAASALLVGGAIGHWGLDKGLGKVINKDGDKTLAGYWANKVYEDPMNVLWANPLLGVMYSNGKAIYESIAKK